MAKAVILINKQVTSALSTFFPVVRHLLIPGMQTLGKVVRTNLSEPSGAGMFIHHTDALTISFRHQRAIWLQESIPV